MAARPRFAALQLLILLLGFSLLLVGAYYPVMARTLNTWVNQAIITITGTQQNLVLTLGISVVGQSSAPLCPTCGPTYMELNIGDTIILTGYLRDSTTGNGIPNVNVDAYVGTTKIATYVTGSSGVQSGQYGCVAGCGFSPALIQFKSDGLYVNGVKTITQTITVGSSFIFKTKYGTTESNQATVKIVGGLPQPPEATVRLEGCDKTLFTLTASSNIQTCAPIYFEVKITKNVDNVGKVTLEWKRIDPNPMPSYNLFDLTRGSPPIESGFTASQSAWYGGLNVPAAKYEVHVKITPMVGSVITVLSIIGWFGVSPEFDDSYLFGVGFLIIGAITTLAGAYMFPRRPQGMI